ncbi:hypothetical protein [Streptomyces mirabilis]|uniref:hypothetical protein n=1 Tax=Streptomyces mirabilis TaxID=68239 RepID=UPI0033E43180
MTDRLGPLEFTNGEWAIGDLGGDHLRLSRAGLSHQVQGVEAQWIAWSRVVGIVLSVQPLRRDHSKKLRKAAVMLSWLGAPTDHVGLPASIKVLTRSPYEELSADFTHHAHRYPRREIAAAGMLLDEVVASGRVTRLGDADWLTAVVRELSGHRYGSRATFPRKRAIKEALDACNSSSAAR